MDKKLPGVFANKIGKKINNNRQVYYSNGNEKNVKNEELSLLNESKIPKKELNINQKINKIFASPKYVYKADVNITLKDEIVKCRIIGRNSTHLITMTNELIPLNDIIDIDFEE